MQIAQTNNEALIDYYNSLKSKDIQQAQNILNSLVESYPKDKLYKLLILTGFNQKGFLLFHRQNATAKYWQGEDIQDKSIFIYSNVGFEHILHTLRFLPCIKSLNPSNITIQVPTIYLEFFQNKMPDIYSITDTPYKSQNTQYDHHCDVLSLPYIFDLYDELPHTPCYFRFEHKSSFNTLSIGLFLNQDISNANIDFGQNINTQYIKPCNDISALEEQIKIKDVIVTDDSMLAHLCGVMNIKCYFISPIVGGFEWGIDSTNQKQSIWYQNVYLFRQNISLEQTILDISMYIKKDKITKSSKLPLANKENNHYSFSKKRQTIFLGKNVALFEKANKEYDNLNFKQSINTTQELLEQYPTSHELNYLMAKIYIKFKKFDEAIMHLNLSIKNKPNSKSYYQIGRILQAQKKYQESITQYKNAISISPQIKYYNSLAMIYQYNLGDNKLGIETLEQCIQTCDCSKHSFIYYNLGVFYQEKQDGNIENNIKQAIKYFKQDISINPDSAKTYNNIGNSYRYINDNELSVKYLQKAIEVNPHYDKSYSNLAITLKNTAQYDNIIDIYNQGLSVTTDNQYNISWNLSLGYLLFGEYTIGWELYESRLQKPEFSSYYKGFDDTKIYNGEDLCDKHILVHYEQGFGDTIQFIRYLELLEQSNPSKITMICQPELISLFEYSMPKHIFCEYKDMPNDYDYHCALMSLPYLFDSQISTIPNKIPYLSAPPKETKEYEFDKTKTNIIIVWKVSNTALDKEIREIELEYFKTLNKINNSKLFSIQMQQTDDVKKETNNITDLSEYINDFSSTARILQDIDLVVCVDTAIAHLCGALNIPCFMILNQGASWRWLQDTSNSIWYKSLKMYRIDDKNNSQNIFENICNDIKSMPKQKLQTSKQTIQAKPQDLEKKYKAILLRAKEFYDNSEFDKAYTLAIRLVLKIQTTTTLGLITNIEIKRFNQTNNNHFRQSATFYLKKLLQINESLEYYYQLGMLYKNSTKQEEIISAIHYFEKALEYSADDKDIQENLLNLYSVAQIYDKAINIATNLATSKPKHFEYQYKLSFLYEVQQEYDLALTHYVKALNIRQSSKIYCNIANIYKVKSDYKNAITYSKKAMAMDYNNSNALEILGTSYKHENQIQQAKECYETLFKSNKDNPTIGHNLAFLYLLQGDYKNGWKSAETRLNFPMLQNVLKLFDKNKRYKGEALEGKTIALHYEQGFGDTIQFIRFLHDIKAKNPKNIMLIVQPELIDLFSNSFKYAQVLDYKKCTQENIPYYDYQCPIMSLPYILNNRLHNIPNKMPYIIPTTKNTSIKIDPTKLNIGITWETNRQSDSHGERSSSLGCFRKILDMPNSKTYSLQVGSGVSEIAHLKLQDKIVDTSHYLTDFNHTASLIEQLDVIISVDTVIAHLSGALNKKCFVLLPFNPNWRWLIDSQTSPWYPSINIIRQKYQDSIDKYPIEEDYELAINEQVYSKLKNYNKKTNAFLS